MMTQTTEYALQALGFLAARPGEWQGVGQVSAALDIPSNYLSKILGQLVRAGVLESRKGWGGGFRIRGNPRRIPLEEIVRAIEGLGRQRACAFGLPECSDDAPCPLHEHWKRLKEEYTSMLREVTVADLVGAASQEASDASTRPAAR